MKKHLYVFLISTSLVQALFQINALAIDTDRCPEIVSGTIDVERVYATSRYSKFPGWSDAQSALKSSPQLQVYLKLHNKKLGQCNYKGEDGLISILHTAEFYDPEVTQPSLVNQIILNFKVDESTFVSYVPISEYSRKSIALYDSPFRVKVKTSLSNPKTKRRVRLDLGMINLNLE